MPEPQPLHHSQLLFPSAHISINKTLTDLKRSNLTISNRLKSIAHDARFVQNVASAYQLPLIANERCGSWYVPPSLKAGSAYFKSTDGHYGQWSFSLRRLNLQILDVVGEFGGCIIVDSTRRGKSMPDALSKTVAIWIAVLNRVLFPEEIESHILQTPENVISRSEHAQIETRLSNFVPELRGLRIDMNSLCTKLQGKPLEPLWVTPDTLLPNSPLQRTDRNLVVLCTASGRTNYEPSMSDYVQGAADDSESWALGMDPATFWKHNAQLLSSSEDELPEVISTLDAGARLDVPVRSPVLIKPTSNIWIANNSTAELLHADFDVVVSCSEKPNDVLVQKLKGRYIHLHCTTGKVGSRQLRHEMPKLSRFTRVISSATRILVACQTGRDLAVGAALAIICLYCSEHGTLRSVDSSGRSVELNKAIIKHRLSWIMVSMPDASPSRATLQSVNAFLLG